MFDHRLRVLVGLALPGQSLLDLLWSARGAQLGLRLAALLVHCPAGCYALWRTRNTTGVLVPYDADSLLTLVMFVPRAWPAVALLLRFAGAFGARRPRIPCKKQLRPPTNTLTRAQLSTVTQTTPTHRSGL